MVLVDTSIRINFLNKGDTKLSSLLRDGKVVIHEFVIGELACGNISIRQNFFNLLTALPKVKTCMYDEIIYFINNNNLFGRGIGFIDAHLLASALITNVKLWTADKNLQSLSSEFNIEY